MPTPGEHKTVQARILAYAEAIGWTFVPREEAERRRGFDPEVPSADRAKNRSLFFDDLLDANPPSPRGYGVAGVREFNPRYAEAEGVLLGLCSPSPRLRRTGRNLHTDIHGIPPSPIGSGGTSREFVEHLRNPPSLKGYSGTGRGKFFDSEEKRERDLTLIASTESTHHEF